MIQIECIGGRACPVISCDDCGQRITDATMAGVVWPLGGRRELLKWDDGVVFPRFLCKTGDCLARCDWPWGELDVWLVQLVHNLGLSTPLAWRHARRKADPLESLSF